MKKLFTSISILLLLTNANAQYQGPVAPIESGYGADGEHGVSVVSFPSPLWPERDVTIFYPADLTEAVLTVFYSHGYGGSETSNCIELFHHIAKAGYAIVFSPYSKTSSYEEIYNTLFEGFKKAVGNYPQIIDSSRVGFMGHSFGGGATPEMAKRGFVKNNWGEKGKFMFVLAPWYSLEISQEELENFPPDVNLVVQLYNDDSINDHRMGIDIFKNIGIPDSRKDLIILYSDVVDSFIFKAGHSVPSQYSSNAVFDAYDYYAVFRIFDALADFTNGGDQTAKNVALGNGSPEQIDMGPFRPLFECDNPVPQHLQNKYKYPWDSDDNPRKDYWSGISGIEKQNLTSTFVLFPNYPNPFNSQTVIKYQLQISGLVELDIFDTSGQKIVTLLDEGQAAGLHEVVFNAKEISSGVYFYRLKFNGSLKVQKMLLIE